MFNKCQKIQKISLNNKLIFWFPKQEEKYIEILEKDDPELIEALEQYINYLDSTEELHRVIKEYKQVIDDIKQQDPDDIKSINKIIEPYLNK